MEKNQSKIKVIGVGGAGGNAIQDMVNSNLNSVEIIYADTDFQALEANQASTKIQLGKKLTPDPGAKVNAEIGKKAAIESINAIRDVIGNDTEIVFITAGMGGGTGTGAAPEIAFAAKQLGVLTVAIVMMPFAFEGHVRNLEAKKGLEVLAKQVDTLIVLPNDRVMKLDTKNINLKDMFHKANEILLNAVRSISDMIMRSGLINVDFSDVRTILSNSGLGGVGAGSATGENRAKEAAERAITNLKLFEGIPLDNAKGIIFNINADESLSSEEIQTIEQTILSGAGNNSNILMGVGLDEALAAILQVTIITTGTPLAM